MSQYKPEDWANTRLRHLAKRLGFYIHKHRDAFMDVSGNLREPGESGLFDYLVCIKGQAAFIESKASETSFSFDRVRPSQRDWQFFTASLTEASYWLWLVMGRKQSHPDYEECPEQAWMIPWSNFLNIEGDFPQKSIPYSSDYTKLLSMKDAKQNALVLFAPYALTWMPTRQWVFPGRHPFLEKFNLYDTPIPISIF